MQRRKGPDTLDKTVTYLAKRDGIDKASKAKLQSQNESGLLSEVYCTPLQPEYFV